MSDTEKPGHLESAQTSQSDVGYLQKLAYHGPEEILPQLRQAALDIGHAGFMEIVHERTGTSYTPDEIRYALGNATDMRGTSIDDVRTSTGKLYQGLFGRDFDSLGVTIALDGGSRGKFSYSEILAMQNELRLTNWALLKQKGCSPPEPNFTDGFRPNGINLDFVNGVNRLTALNRVYAAADAIDGRFAVARGNGELILTYFANDGTCEQVRIRRDSAPDYFTGHYDKEGVYATASPVMPPVISARQDIFGSLFSAMDS